MTDKEKLLEIINRVIKRHKHNSKSCADCGLFNVVKGEVCKCEWNMALKNVVRLVLGKGEEKTKSGWFSAYYTKKGSGFNCRRALKSVIKNMGKDGGG